MIIFPGGNLYATREKTHQHDCLSVAHRDARRDIKEFGLRLRAHES